MHTILSFLINVKLILHVMFVVSTLQYNRLIYIALNFSQPPCVASLITACPSAHGKRLIPSRMGDLSCPHRVELSHSKHSGSGLTFRAQKQTQDEPV